MLTRLSLHAAVCAFMLAAAGTAHAAIIVETGVDKAGTQNVVSNPCSGNTTSGMTVQGCLNQDKTRFVNFTGTEKLKYTGGQATLDAKDGSFTYVLIALADGGIFSKLLLNIDADANGFVTFTGSTGGTSAPFALKKKGQNKFTITGENFTSITIQSTVQIDDIKQVRLGLAVLDDQDDPPTSSVVIPEPGTLALFGAGLFGLGLVRRTRRRA